MKTETTKKAKTLDELLTMIEKEMNDLEQKSISYKNNDKKVLMSEVCNMEANALRDIYYNLFDIMMNKEVE